MTVPRITSRRKFAQGIALILLGIVFLACAVESARSSPRQELRAAAAIRAEFGTGWLAGCFLGIAYRETGGTFNPRSANLTDRHADGSVGSFGILQIGALWRRPGESVAGFARRMYQPAEAARLAHRIYQRFGLQPWGGSCS